MAVLHPPQQPGRVITRADQAAPAGARRVCLISDLFSQAADEGINKYAVALAEALGHRHDVLTVATRRASAGNDSHAGLMSRAFLGRPLRERIRDFDPDLVIYLPTASTTLWSFLRGRLLSSFSPRAVVCMVGLQPRVHSSLAQRVIARVAPDVLFVQSQESKQYFEQLGCRVALTPSGVDTETFHPVPESRRAELRAEYGLLQNLPVVLHVGHLNARRGVATLADLAATGRCQVVLVASASTEQDRALATELRQGGVVVIGTYQPNIEAFYQLADCYVFPVRSAQSAIEVPLSVLEALACDLPVVTTPFGGLPRMFAGVAHPGLTFVDSPTGLVAETLRVTTSGVRGARQLALPYSWDAVAAQLVEVAMAAPRSRRRTART